MVRRGSITSRGCGSKFEGSESAMAGSLGETELIAPAKQSNERTGDASDRFHLVGVGMNPARGGTPGRVALIMRWTERLGVCRTRPRPQQSSTAGRVLELASRGIDELWSALSIELFLDDRSKDWHQFTSV
jgi:hypothetical protein